MTNGKTMLTASATFHCNGVGGRTEEHYWGELSPDTMPAIRQWFGEHQKARGKDLVGAYLYVRTGVFSADPAYHTPNRMAYMLADFVHVS